MFMLVHMGQLIDCNKKSSNIERKELEESSMVDTLTDFGPSDAILFGDMSGISLPPTGLLQLTQTNSSNGVGNGALNTDWSAVLPPMMTSSIPLTLSTGSISMTLGLDEPIAHVAGESSTSVLSEYDNPPPLQHDSTIASSTALTIIPTNGIADNHDNDDGSPTSQHDTSSTSGTTSNGVLAPYLLHVPSKLTGDDRPCPFGCGKMYKRSSQRALSKHLLVCRRRPPEADDAQLQQLASTLPSVKRKRRRSAELATHEKWVCPHGCGKYYRTTSTRSIREHAATCNGIPVTTHIHVRTVSAAAANKRPSSSLTTVTKSLVAGGAVPSPIILPMPPSSPSGRARTRARHDEIVDAESFHARFGGGDGKVPIMMLTKVVKTERHDFAERLMHDLPSWAPWFASTIEEALLVRATGFSNIVMWYYRVSVMSGPSFHRCLAASPHLRQLLRLPAPPTAVGVACRNHGTRFGVDDNKRSETMAERTQRRVDETRQRLTNANTNVNASTNYTSTTGTTQGTNNGNTKLPLPLVVQPVPISDAPPGLPTTELQPNETASTIPTVHFPATITHTDCPKARLKRDLEVGEVVMKEVAKSVALASAPDAAPSTPSAPEDHHGHHGAASIAVAAGVATTGVLQPTMMASPAVPPSSSSHHQHHHQDDTSFALGSTSVTSPISPESTSSSHHATPPVSPSAPVSPHSSSSSSSSSPISPVSPPPVSPPSDVPIVTTIPDYGAHHRAAAIAASIAPTNGLRAPLVRRPPMEMHSAEVRVVHDHRFDHLPCAVLSIRCDYPTPLEATPAFDPNGDRWPNQDDPPHVRPHLVMTYGMNQEYDRLIGFEPGQYDFFFPFGWRRMLGIYEADDMSAMCRHIFRCNLGITREFRMQAKIHTKWSVMPVVMTVKYAVDDDGMFQSATFCMVPLPQPSLPPPPPAPPASSSSSSSSSSTMDMQHQRRDPVGVMDASNPLLASSQTASLLALPF